MIKVDFKKFLFLDYFTLYKYFKSIIFIESKTIVEKTENINQYVFKKY